jgi:protein gp37
VADNTHIEWTDATWNPITGCTVVSPGCTNCYAMRLAGTRLQHHPSRAGLTVPSKAGPVWNGQVRLNEEWLDQPLRWRKPRRIFVCAHGDLFHESVPDAWIDRVFAAMALAPQHTFQVLTKRADRMRRYLTQRDGMGNGALCHAINRIPFGLGNRHGALEMPLPNVQLGISAEDQKRADERIPHLLLTPAAARFVSLEPLLGAVDLTGIDYVKFMDSLRTNPRANPDDPNWPPLRYDTLRGHMKGPDDIGLPRLDWVIVGGESGPGARPMHPDWVRSLRDQCVGASVPFFFKQWGEWAPETVFASRQGAETALRIDLAGNTREARYGARRNGEVTIQQNGKAKTGATLDGREWREMPA